MGNCEIQKRSTEVVGTITITLDKTRLSRGDLLTGRLILKLFKDFPGRQLSVRVRGIESMKKGSEQAENEIFGDTVLLLAVGQLKEGEHKYYFDYVLPEKLQSQFSSRVMSLKLPYAVSMVYQVKGQLDPVELVQDEFPAITGAAYFSLLAQVSKEGVSSTSTGSLKNEHEEYGAVEIVLHSTKSAYEGGEIVQIQLTINNSDVAIPLEVLSFNVIREIQFFGKSTNAYIKTIRRELTPNIVKDVILQSDIKFERGELDQIASKTVEFELPPDLQPSFQGKQFQCRYFFEIYAHYVKTPTNFIDAKARLKLNIIPEKSRNYIDLNKMAQSSTKKLNTVTKAKINNDLIASQIHLGYNSNRVSQHNGNINSNVNNSNAKISNSNGVSMATTANTNNIVSQNIGENYNSAKPAEDASITQHPINASIHQNNNQNTRSPSPNNNNWDLESQEGHVPRKVNI